MDEVPTVEALLAENARLRELLAMITDLARLGLSPPGAAVGPEEGRA